MALAVRGRYLPGLDGLRALAIAGVVAYHLGLGWAAGGYLGVDLFFVLSGFLITGLLLEQWLSTGAIALGSFWARRARRLLPALLVLLFVLALAAWSAVLVGGTDLASVRGDALATLFYVANWHQLAAGQSYFAQFSAPSPLQHTWSLAIEEQYYLLWPPVLLGVLWVVGARQRTAPGAVRWRRPVFALSVTAAAASATWMAWLAWHGASLDRLYYGTDTRAFDLLAGAALASVVAGRPEPGRRSRHILHVAAPVAGAGLAAGWWLAGGPGGPPRAVFEGGMALAALAAVVVVADARLEQPGALGTVLRLAPLRLVGRISYGLYLWHWPVITEMTPGRTGLDGAALDLARIATMVALAAVSYVAVERPLRRLNVDSWPKPARLATWPVAVGATVGAVVLGTVVSGPAPASAVAPPLGAVVVGAGGLGGEVRPELPPGRLVSRHDPLRVTLVGDSVMRAEAPALKGALDATGRAAVTDASFPGWGLSTDSGWRYEIPALLARSRPDVVVAMWSWDDDWLLADPAGFGSVVRQFVGLLLHPGAGVRGASAVLFEQFPPLGPLALVSGGPAGQARRLAGVAAWNTFVSTLPKAFPGRVLYLPVGKAVEDGGRFSAWLPAGDTAPSTAPTSHWVRVRTLDNTHFCPEGAARYAAAAEADVGSLFSLPAPAPAWWTGTWRDDSAVYDTPPGSCPDDHPT
ncbi:MAG TPA: acyltransferase family protein [Acidimicrobiales bacterium]|nr:acyltransferase family protein [Acidimicrobiales bacterium]